MFTKNNGESITSTLRCRHLNVIKHFIEQFANNFSLNVSKEKKVLIPKKMVKGELLTNGVVLIFLTDEFEIKDGPTCSEKDEYEMVIMTDCDIQEFKETQTMY
jgi:hypothetical protein